MYQFLLPLVKETESLRRDARAEYGLVRDEVSARLRYGCRTFTDIKVLWNIEDRRIEEDFT